MKIDERALSKIFSWDLEDKYCIEINFQVESLQEYNNCWMGKMPSTDRAEIYWFGLVSDGSKAYDYKTFSEMYQAPVFDGKSLKELLPLIDVLSIDSIEPEERLAFYLSE